MRITTDVFAYCRAVAEVEHDLDLRLPHSRRGLDGRPGARLHAGQRDRVCPGGGRRGALPDELGARLSFFFNAHNHFFQEVAKFRAARRLWARIMSERFGATNPKALALRFHAQTGGSTLTAQQPENNIVRVAIQALSAWPAARSRSTRTGSTKRWPCRRSGRQDRPAERQILAHEAGGTHTADPLGGAYFIETLTPAMEESAWELIGRVDS